MILLSHPTGNNNVRQALQAFDEAGLLGEFCTTICWNPEHLFSRIVPRIGQQLNRRSYSLSIRSKARTHPWRESGRLLAGALGWKKPLEHESGALCIDAVCRDLDSWVSSRLENVRDIDRVYAYEDAALLTFKRASALGISKIYEHPVGYWREVQALFEEERELSPDYAPVLAGIGDSPEKRERKDEEIALADLIIVPSQYSALSLRQCPKLAAEIRIVNYGAPTSDLNEPVHSGPRRLKVMFVGSVQQRKGISYLVKAIDEVRSVVDITVIGSRVGVCRPVDKWLESVRWIPSIPHNQVLDEMRDHDVLVLPSLSEGFGLVVLEAMSQGMTVVVSENTGAKDIVQDGLDGYIVPIRSQDAIAHCLHKLASNPEHLMSMRRAALLRAKSCVWENYRKAVVEVVNPLAHGGQISC